jgi:hypothetical protein
MQVGIAVGIDATIPFTGCTISVKEKGAISIRNLGCHWLAASQRKELTVAEEDGVKRGEDGAGVHEPLGLPPLALGRRRLPLPRRPSVQIRLVAPIKNRVLVPAIGHGAGLRHRPALSACCYQGMLRLQQADW